MTCLSWLAIVQLLTLNVNGYEFEVLFRRKPSFLILVSLSTITCLELSPSLRGKADNTVSQSLWLGLPPEVF